MASASIGFSHHLFTATLISSSVLAMFGTASGADGSLPEVSDMINSQEYGRARFLFLLRKADKEGDAMGWREGGTLSALPFLELPK